MPGPGTLVGFLNDRKATQAGLVDAGDWFIGSSATTSTHGDLPSTSRIVFYVTSTGAFLFNEFGKNIVCDLDWTFITLQWGATENTAGPPVNWGQFQITSISYDATTRRLQMNVSELEFSHAAIEANAANQLIAMRMLSRALTVKAPPQTDFTLYYDDIAPPIPPDNAGQYSFKRWDISTAYSNPTWLQIRRLTDPPPDPGTQTGSVSFALLDADGVDQTAQHNRTGDGSLYVYYIGPGQWAAFDVVNATISSNLARCTVFLGQLIDFDQSGSTAAPGDRRVEHRFSEP